jgi:formylglycine-generating enzyme required for sulfatase activity
MNKLNSMRVSRRQFIQVASTVAAVGGVGGGITVVRNLFHQAATPTPAMEFEIATVNAQGKVVKRDKGSISVFTEDLGQGVKLELSVIPAGTFQMGSPKTEAERFGVDTQHPVNVPSFWMGRYQITQAQWKRVVALPKVNRYLNSDPSYFKGDDRPIEQVSWFDAVEFCDRLSRLTKREYRLPTEAEWEYTCGARTTTPFHFGVTITTDLANYRGTDQQLSGETYPGSYGAGPKGIYREQTTDVGSFPANAFGLYDMHGNVWEWCLDHWHDDYKGSPTDGTAWLDKNADENESRVLRGGSWDSYPRYCRSASRLSFDPRTSYYNFFGFRVVCLAPSTLG